MRRVTGIPAAAFVLLGAPAFWPASGATPGVLAALPLATAARAQSQDAGPGVDLPAAEGEVRPGLGVEASRELGDPQGEPLSGEELDRAVALVAADIRCPKCQALSIADSGASSAQAMRAEARSLLASGYTRDQVVLYFEQRYGEFVLLEPRARGLNLIVWTAPAGIVTLGGLLVARRLRQRRSADEGLDAYLRQVERDDDADGDNGETET
ncbi:MAG: cytochrome c-type biogenesis protein CcmH [Acidobacteria bacterium]|nr:cytochrome c-type biogenesis protein CcmH [Acidobacteriota bacterium]